MPRFSEDNARLRAELPDEVQEVLDWHEARGYTNCPEYQGAVAFWFQRHICRLQPWPDGLERAFSGMGAACYAEMIGPSELQVVGNLKDWDVMPRLGEVAYPTLFIAGRYDEVRPEHVREAHERTPRSEFVLFEQSAHLPFEEERVEFMTIVNDFLARAESWPDEEGALRASSGRHFPTS